MSLAPGSTVVGTGQLSVTSGAGTVPNFFNQGIGFMNNGSVAIDTNAVAGTAFDGGVRQSAAGAFYGTLTPAGTDGVIAGVPVSASGQLVFEVAVATQFSSGNGLTVNARLATN